MGQVNDLQHDLAGIRPKLQGPGDGFRDFVIQHEVDRGLPGLMNLIGIESPGLTASPAIGRYVAGIMAQWLQTPVVRGMCPGHLPRPQPVSEQWSCVPSSV